MQPIQDKGLTLPEPDADSAIHSARVARHIRALIEQSGGDISFAEFMHAALYAPGLGYYSAGANKFGVEGDFVTAPEMSNLFGNILADQCAFVLQQIPGSSILEPGAGSGALAVTMLERLAGLDMLPKQYFILEVSADLRERQEKRLRDEIPQLVDRVVWLSALPTDFCGVIVANEVADALPVERFVRKAGRNFQRRVTTDDKGFAWCSADAPVILQNAISEIEEQIGRTIADDYESEISLGLKSWIGDLARSLQTGFVFLFDYGISRREYYAQDRSQGWLRCHFRHYVHNDPLLLPGIQDLTAWVDFTSVAEAATDADMCVAGYVSQAHFLMGGGLEEELAGFTSLAVEAQVELSRQVKLLTLPTEMGENFKCMGLSVGSIESPPAFALSDRRHAL